MAHTPLPPLQHPFQAIPYRRRLALFLAFLALSLLIVAVFQVLDIPMRTAAAPQGIVSYELAGSLDRTAAMIASWDARARLYAALGLGLDFLFMPAYAITIALACAWAAQGWGRRWLASLGAALAWGLGLAALLDAIENIALSVMLLAVPADPWPAVAAGCATVKFALIVVALVYALVGLARWVAARVRG